MAHKKQIMAHKKMYCYDDFYKGVINPALYVHDSNLCDSLKLYYQKTEKGNFKASFNFQPNLVPLDTCVYVLDYNKDSSIVKIAFYYQYNNRNLSDDGYVYGHTLHAKRKYNRKPSTIN
jgi:hypothetical protein